MSYLILLPWLKLGDHLNLGEFELGSLSTEEIGRFDLEPELIKNAVEPFRINRQISISKFTYVSKDDQLLNDYSEADINKFNFLHELLVISGLANRQFFNSLLYCNADQFDYYIRSLKGENNFETISGRRRDGATKNFISDEALIIVQPPHIPSKTVPYRINQNLIKSLHEASQILEDRDWNKIYNSILNFNQSNTDNAKITQTQEIILMSSAFEQLLSEPNLANDFQSLLSDYCDLKKIGEYPELKQREAKQEVEEECSISKVWMREFILVRNLAAHGHDLSVLNLRWPLKEHLLLASFIYPTILKRKLNEHRVYELTDYDLIRFRAFEELCTVQHLVEYGEEIFEHGFEYPWNEILNRYRFPVFWNRMVRNNE